MQHKEIITDKRKIVLHKIKRREEKQSFNFFYSINAGIYSVLLIFGTEIMLALHISGIPTNIQMDYILKVYNKRKSNL